MRFLNKIRDSGVASATVSGPELDPVSIGSLQHRIGLSCYLLVCLIVCMPVHLAIHESGHLITELLAGRRLVGYYQGFFVAQVFFLPQGKLGISDLAGSIPVIVLSYISYRYLIKVRPANFMLSTLSIVLTVCLLLEPAYIVTSAIAGFGDSYNAARGLGVSRGWFVLFGGALAVFNTELVAVLAEAWFNDFCPSSAKRQRRQVIILCTTALMGMSVLFWVTQF